MVLPKDIRDAQGIREGDMFVITVEKDKIVLSRDKIWEKFRASAKGVVTAEEVELELDEDDRLWEKRLRRLS